VVHSIGRGFGLAICARCVGVRIRTSGLDSPDVAPQMRVGVSSPVPVALVAEEAEERIRESAPNRGSFGGEFLRLRPPFVVRPVDQGSIFLCAWHWCPSFPALWRSWRSLWFFSFLGVELVEAEKFAVAPCFVWCQRCEVFERAG